MFDQCAGVEAIEQLHHVIEPAVLGDAEVEQCHRVRRSQLCDRLRLSLESPLHISSEKPATCPEPEARISLIAAGRASSRWLAFQTSPMPPSPNRDSRR